MYLHNSGGVKKQIMQFVNENNITLYDIWKKFNKKMKRLKTSVLLDNSNAISSQNLLKNTDRITSANTENCSIH